MPETLGNSNVSEMGGAGGGATSVSNDSRLMRLIEVWDTLPDETKAEIIRIANDAGR